MAGIYVHIPFCRKPCNYCDFYFCVSLNRKKELIEAIIVELHERNDYLSNEPIETIYFGGGTPSVLAADELNAILMQIRNNYEVSKTAEITIEANPDDLSKEYLRELSKTAFNRLSIGVQSFNDTDLKWMNRRHNSEQSVNCIKNSITAGFSNISIDLIYGAPVMSNEEWINNIDMAISLNVPHISAYHLTYEPGTILMHKLNKSRIAQINEAKSEDQFNLLNKKIEQAGYVAYEISNFAILGMESKHNSNYWKQKSYLGIGPSAHSFNGQSRRWNLPSLKKYTRSLLNKTAKDNGNYYEIEELTAVMKYNEYVLTGLRTVWGIQHKYINNNFDEKINQYFNDALQKQVLSGMLEESDGVITLPLIKRIISDKIILELIYDDEHQL
jgi:oxygen-independent coproporphyrinogen III oxidase